jgi:hypothetical protein
MSVFSIYTENRNAEKCNYMLTSRRQNVGQNPDLETANRSFENVPKLKYYGKKPNLIYEKIKNG